MPTHYSGDAATRRALDSFIKLSRARKVMSYRTGQLLAEYGLTESQFGTLEALYILGPMSQKEIGDKLMVSGGNMTMVVGNLEKRGYVSRRRNESDCSSIDSAERKFRCSAAWSGGDSTSAMIVIGTLVMW